MRFDDADDEMLRLLARLPVALPDPERAERVRMRCRSAIARRRRERAPERVGLGRRVLEPAVLAGFSLAYLLALLGDVLRVYGKLR